MPVTCEQADRVMILRLTGEIDHHRAKELMIGMDRYIDTYLPRELTVDLSGVTFMDSSGIAVLLRAYRRVRELEGSLRVAGTPAQAAKVLHAAGLSRMIPFD
ncbi:STAS domain-containing protein [uncultured Acetatifactor sp.]|uniref:STAS domain-containing protein n=1 Tax=uncultured Acetatifactor sp. TaxID=1671927 RepID=UPI0021701F95|nr:STAS domain-containing protein [uncultured Acetatifactor sp.]MCI8537799.1 STAS domain-containing protein [Oscillospiraceae bacterium]